jgi:hypothetical protein
MKTELKLDLHEVDDAILKPFQAMVVSLASLSLASPAFAGILRQMGWCVVEELRHRRAGEATDPTEIDIGQGVELTPGEQKVLAGELEHWASTGARRYKAFATCLRTIARAIAELELAPAG